LDASVSRDALAPRATIEDGTMSDHAGRWRRIGFRVAAGVAAPVLFSLGGSALAADPPPAQLPPAPAATAEAPLQVLDLGACRRTALANQPALAAARASVAAAVARAEALDHLHIPSFLARDLPVRRKQAQLGITVAQGVLTQAEGDTIYGVTFSYLSALYAAEQLEVADNGVADLKKLQDLAKEIVQSGSRPDVTQQQVDLIGAYILTVQGRREEAAQGLQRAVSALREAMGVGPDVSFQLADRRLPRIDVAVDREQIIGAALARRGEVVQAATVAQVAGCEVCAQQALLLLPNTRTFAAGSDIHANVLPAGEYDEHYRPGAITVEMPTTLTGSRRDRVEQAKIYSARTASVADKARNLITLEAEQAYLRWLEASQKTPKYRQSADEADKVYRSLRERFDPRIQRIRLDDLINAGVLKTQLRLQANQGYYQLLQALTMLERVTAGGFNAGLDQAVGQPATSGEKGNDLNNNGSPK
jgi:outer membrane protein TolC